MTNWTEKVARAWADMDGKAPMFDKCKNDPETEAVLGWYNGYMSEARELLCRSGVATALDDAQAMVATAYEAAAEAVWVAFEKFGRQACCGDPREYTPECCGSPDFYVTVHDAHNAIRALTPEDAAAALAAERKRADDAASELAALRKAARSVVRAYQEASPMRMADMHQESCGCLRCEIDRLNHVTVS